MVYTPYGAGIGEKSHGKFCEYADAEAREKELLAEKAALIAELREYFEYDLDTTDHLNPILAKYEAKP